MFKKNITFKLTLGFLGIAVVSTLFIGIIALNIFRNNIYEVKKNNMHKHATAISETIKPYVSNSLNDEEFIKMIQLINDIDNAKIWILNIDKSIITASDTDDDIKHINDSEIKDLYDDINSKVLEGTEVYDEGYNPYYNEEMMTIAVPIKDNNAIVGAVILNSSITDLSNSMNKFFLNLILAVLGETVLVGVLGYYFSRNISRPIKKINSSALELARGHYGIKTNIYQKDEIGELSNSFDLLSLKLKHTINELFEEKNKLSNIITSISEGIIAFDRTFNIINTNEAAIKLLSYKKLKDNTEVVKILSDLDIIKEFNSSISANEKKIILKEHGGKVLEFSISPIKNNSNEIIGGVILIQDISEKEKLEQMRKDFISNVSHEFRTPLTVIKGNLESIVDGMTRPEHVAETCITLIKETNRLERMVKDLLNLSRLESGKLELDFTELDVNMLINDTIRSLKPLLFGKNIDLQLSLGRDLPRLLSDYDKLKQLIIIFLDNAIKFSTNKGVLKVTTYTANKNIYIAIKDNGIGIPKNEIAYLGEKFYKADKARNANTGGTGLGLSIAKRLAKVLDAKFFIESDLGKGTTITISFSIV
ncbi:MULTISPECIES: ATP-binding protein [unclassified Clostridium]|uniref:ATP-binding protein n=1 Tax=unclassified Clostridium TaxID=2614128 RepID=UPI0002982792|nr:MULTISPECIES: ATP-binding protein [unclassified Clostridium]EKQ56178.1 MAG: PAS domain S-box [Clostridium sp. Maddingley MBC34-26]